MNAAVCKKEFDEIKGLIASGEILKSLERLTELLDCRLLPKVLPDCNNEILQRLHNRKLQFISHLSRCVLAIAAKQPLQLKELDRATSCLFTFVGHIEKLDAKEIREHICNLTIRLFKLSDGNGQWRLSLRLAGLFVLLAEEQNISTAWACWKSVKLRTPKELEKFTRNFCLLNVIQESHMCLSDADLYVWLKSEVRLYLPQQLYFLEDSITVLLAILRLNIDAVCLADAYASLGEILLHSGEELINFEACCAALGADLDLCQLCCKKGLSLVDGVQTDVYSFVRSKLHLLQFLTSTAEMCREAESTFDEQLDIVRKDKTSGGREKGRQHNNNGSRLRRFASSVTQVNSAVECWKFFSATINASATGSEWLEEFHEFSLQLARVCLAIPRTEEVVDILVWCLLHDSPRDEVYVALGFELLRLNELAGVKAVVDRYTQNSPVSGSPQPAQQPSDQYCRCQMSCLEALTLCGSSGKGGEAQKVLESVRKHELVKQKKTRQAFVVSACVCYAELIASASTACADTFADRNSLERLYERCRFLRAAVDSSVGQRMWEWDKGAWCITMFLRSLEALSLGLLRAGLPLEASVYVKEGVELSGKLHFPFWEVMFVTLQLEVESMMGKMDDVAVTLKRLEQSFNTGPIATAKPKNTTTGRPKRNKTHTESLSSQEASQQQPNRQVENLRRCQSNSDYDFISIVPSVHLGNPNNDTADVPISVDWLGSVLSDADVTQEPLMASVLRVISCCRAVANSLPQSGNPFCEESAIVLVFNTALAVAEKQTNDSHVRLRLICAPLVKQLGGIGKRTSLSLATELNLASCRLGVAQMESMKVQKNWSKIIPQAKALLLQLAESGTHAELTYFRDLVRFYEFLAQCQDQLLQPQEMEENKLVESLSKITLRTHQKTDVKPPKKGVKTRKHLGELQNQEELVVPKEPISHVNSGETSVRHLLAKGQKLAKLISTENFVVQRQLKELLVLISMTEVPHDCFWLLTETVGMGFRHQFAYAAALRLERIKTEDDIAISTGDKVLLPFCNTNEIVERLNSMPANWTVLQLMRINSVRGSEIVAARYSRNREPIVLPLPLGVSHETHLELLRGVVEGASASVKEKDKKIFWDTRKRLDTQLKDLLTTIEREWFGHWKALLLGQLPDSLSEAHESCVRRITSMVKSSGVKLSKELCELIVESCLVMESDELTNLIRTTVPSDPSVIKSVLKVLEVYKIANSFEDSMERGPVVLVLDKALVSVPWESLPIMANQRVSRVPCLHLIPYLLKRWETKRVIDHRRLFYLLNPGGDLPETERRLGDWLKGEDSFRWTGIIGERPDSSKIRKEFLVNDLYLYAGHGSGSTYLPLKDLRKVQSPAAVFLMGCSSGRPLCMGPTFDATSVTVESYLFSESVAVVANLWDVTDRDIDHFLVATLSQFVGKKPLVEMVQKGKVELPPTNDLLTAVSRSRRICKLRHLNGAAPVVFGLPVQSDLSHTDLLS